MLKTLIRKEQAEISNAVLMFGKGCEEKGIPIMAKALAEWAGKRLWRTGYEAENVKLYAKQFDYDRRIGVGITIDANKVPLTIRQFCYQYLKVAEEAKNEIEILEKENNKLKNHWFYRWFIRK